ncbi:IPT/TIG domain-containing protein, partial [Nocardia asiatica]|uniref:IPT/TIG domain-containing protein n=1 Tax=Nocardia asiatica TaxID=209252 RepID=UPI001C3F2C39
WNKQRHRLHLRPGTRAHLGGAHHRTGGRRNDCGDHRYGSDRATAVDFGATPATSFTVDSPTQITAVAPAGTGTVQITTTTAGGTSNGIAFTYIPAPALTLAVPNTGLQAGGTTVVITGTDLTGTTSVDFGATPATSFTVDSPTQITAVSPAGTGTVQLTATTAGGTSNGLSFIYI